MRTCLRLTPRCLYLLCLGWLLVVRVTSALGGGFQVGVSCPLSLWEREQNKHTQPVLERRSTRHIFVTSALCVAERMVLLFYV